MKKTLEKSLYQTAIRWNKELWKWVCIYCGNERKKKYIATSHDHTDYSYDLCDCNGAKANGLHESKLN